MAAIWTGKTKQEGGGGGVCACPGYELRGCHGERIVGLCCRSNCVVVVPAIHLHRSFTSQSEKTHGPGCVVMVPARSESVSGQIEGEK